MNKEKIKIEFWKDKKNNYPVIIFLDKLPEKISKQIHKKINDVILELDFNRLIQRKDDLTIMSEYRNLTPQPYEVKFKSQKVRILAYRKQKTLVFVKAVIGSFSNKKLLKKAINIYKKRVCQ